MSGYEFRRAPRPRPDKEHVYALDVIYPPGSIVYRPLMDGCPAEWWFNPDWKPTGWVPDDDYIAEFGTVKFVWPKARRIYVSRTAAQRRARLLESYGATVRILRSPCIEWEEAPRRKKPARTLESYFFGEDTHR